MDTRMISLSPHGIIEKDVPISTLQIEPILLARPDTPVQEVSFALNQGSFCMAGVADAGKQLIGFIEHMDLVTAGFGAYLGFVNNEDALGKCRPFFSGLFSGARNIHASHVMCGERALFMRETSDPLSILLCMAKRHRRVLPVVSSAGEALGAVCAETLLSTVLDHDSKCNPKGT